MTEIPFVSTTEAHAEARTQDVCQIDAASSGVSSPAVHAFPIAPLVKVYAPADDLEPLLPAFSPSSPPVTSPPTVRLPVSPRSVQAPSLPMRPTDPRRRPSDAIVPTSISKFSPIAALQQPSGLSSPPPPTPPCQPVPSGDAPLTSKSEQELLFQLSSLIHYQPTPTLGSRVFQATSPEEEEAYRVRPSKRALDCSLARAEPSQLLCSFSCPLLGCLAGTSLGSGKTAVLMSAAPSIISAVSLSFGDDCCDAPRSRLIYCLSSSDAHSSPARGAGLPLRHPRASNAPCAFFLLSETDAQARQALQASSDASVAPALAASADPVRPASTSQLERSVSANSSQPLRSVSDSAVIDARRSLALFHNRAPSSFGGQALHGGGKRSASSSALVKPGETEAKRRKV